MRELGSARMLERACRNTALTVALALILAGVYAGAYFLRFDGDIDATHFAGLLATLPIFVLLKSAVFVWFRLHRGWGRFVTFHDLTMVAEAATLGSLLIVLFDHLVWIDWTIPRSVVVLDWGATLIVIGGLRSIGRSVHGRYRRFFVRGGDVRRALIVGANNAGEALLRSIQFNGRIPYDIVGFVDGDAARVGETLAGVPIVGRLGQTCELARRHAAEEVLITAGELPGTVLRQIVEACRAQGIRVSMLPSYEQLLSGQVAIKTRDVSIDDLLHRDQVKLDTGDIEGWLHGRTLMVTGSAGSIGSEVCRQLLQFAPARLVLVDRSENGQFHIERQIRDLAPHVSLQVRIADIADSLRMRQIFAEFQPDILFHAAAYKHVPLMEENPGEAIKNNVAATRRLADLADDCGLKAFVLISTDKAVNPTSVMGACKRAAELYVQSLAERSECRFVTVRFGNVLDSAGSVVPIFREQIARGGPVTITDERMQRFFMTIPEAAQLVIQAGAMGLGGEIFVLEMGDPVRILDLAQDMIRLSGLRLGEDIEIEFTGLRPGEKLFEELHSHGEVHQPTRHPKIRVALNNPILTSTEIAAETDRLTMLADGSEDRMIEQLRRLVPEYSPGAVALRGPRLFDPASTTVPNASQPRAA